MANEIVPIGQQVQALTASMRAKMQSAVVTNRNFAGNIRASYPLLSVRGKAFIFRLPDGREQPHVDHNGYKLPYLDVVLLDASNQLAKTFYMKGFDPNEFSPPDCWSLDSVRPDASVVNKQNDLCGTCPQNMFGSRVTPSGKKAKACADHRRVVVLMPHQMGQLNATPLMLRVPQSSLKNLKAHAEVLEKYGVDIKACISRLSFTDEAYPQLVFTYVNVLDEAGYDFCSALANTDMVKGMISTPDFENARTVPTQDSPGTTQGLKALEAAPPPVGFDKLLQEKEEAVAGATNAQPAPQETPSHIIELPEGKLFDTLTKQYVERPQPKVEMPEMDPDVIELPEGKWFNTVTKQYVDGPQKHAKAPAVEPKKARTRVKLKDEPAQQAGEKVIAKEDVKPGLNGNDKPLVSATSGELDDVLASLMPNPKQ